MKVSDQSHKTCSENGQNIECLLGNTCSYFIREKELHCFSTDMNGKGEFVTQKRLVTTAQVVQKFFDKKKWTRGGGMEEKNRIEYERIRHYRENLSLNKFRFNRLID